MDAAHLLNGVRDFVPPSWRAFADGARPQTPDIESVGTATDGSTLWRRGRTKCSRNACSSTCLTALWLRCGPRGDLELWLSHVSDHEAGSPALPCDSSLPSPVAPSLPSPSVPAGVALPLDSLGHHRARAVGFGREGMGSREYCSSYPAVREAVVSQPCGV